MKQVELKLSERQMKLLEGMYLYSNENGEVVAWEANRESDYTEAGLKRTITILEGKGLIKIVSGSKTRAWTLVIALTEAGKEVIGANEELKLNLYKIEFEDENFEIISARNEMEARWSAETYQEEHGYIMEVNQVDENYEPINSEKEEPLFDVDSEDIEDIWNMDIELDIEEQQEQELTVPKECTKVQLQDLIDDYHTYKPLRVRSERLIEMEKMINKHTDEHGYSVHLFIKQGLKNQLLIDKEGETVLDWIDLNNNEIYEKITGMYMISLDIDAGFIKFKTEEDAILEDILNKWKVYKATYILGVEYIVMDSEEAARDIALSLEPTYDDLISLEEVTEYAEIDEDLKATLIRGYKKGDTEFKVEREKNKIWNELLDEVLCYKDINGNRPCDNGCICDKCSSNWFYEMYENKLINAGLYK